MTSHASDGSVNLMEEILATVRAFCAGEVAAAEFRARLYSDQRFESFLKNDPNLRPDSYVKGSVYQFLLQLDFDDPRDIVNAQGALTQYMDRNGIAYVKTDRYAKFNDLIAKAQPSWLDVDLKYIQEKMLPDAGARSGTELRDWLQGEFRRRFRCVKKPPKWIQGPAWPIGANGPLVFLGQVEVKEYFHDSAAVYVFHDPATGACETVVQVY